MYSRAERLAIAAAFVCLGGLVGVCSWAATKLYIKHVERKSEELMRNEELDALLDDYTPQQSPWIADLAHVQPFAPNNTVAFLYPGLVGMMWGKRRARLQDMPPLTHPACRAAGLEWNAYGLAVPRSWRWNTQLMSTTLRHLLYSGDERQQAAERTIVQYDGRAFATSPTSGGGGELLTALHADGVAPMDAPPSVRRLLDEEGLADRLIAALAQRERHVRAQGSATSFALGSGVAAEALTSGSQALRRK